MDETIVVSRNNFVLKLMKTHWKAFPRRLVYKIYAFIENICVNVVIVILFLLFMNRKLAFFKCKYDCIECKQTYEYSAY